MTWRFALSALLVSLPFGIFTIKAVADEVVPVFEMDCISFSGRGLANAPLKKKKPHSGLAADGTTWAAGADGKVTVTKVFPGEPAEKEGVEVGDEIITVNGYTVNGLPKGELFYAYHMYEPDNVVETLVLQKKDGTQKTVKLPLLTLDKCDPEEKKALIELYKTWGY